MIVRRFILLALGLSMGLGPRLAAASGSADAVAWQPWSDAAFAQARREHKFVLLDLQAVWCHWCHVMDAVTYQDPAVTSLLAQHYVALKVDQDSRPDLANRYEDYGWPATVIYAPDGTEIVKKQGYLTPSEMTRLLKAVIADPSPVDYHDAAPEAPASTPTTLGPERRAALRRQWLDGYDEKGGGWGFSHKFLDWDSVELAMREAAHGDAASARRARETLRLQLNLVDPVWGGVFQYSVGGGWTEPHYEKIMQMQAENLRIYALAWAQWGDPAYLDAARKIRSYLQEFLSGPEGAYYVSQDADLSSGEGGADYYALNAAGRRRMGTPRIDAHLYARENGWAIAALAEYAEATGDVSATADAQRAARWIAGHRALPDGGFRHGASDPAGPYLGDTLAMGRAFLALHEATAAPGWLARAESAAHFIQAHFGRGAQPGFAASDTLRPDFPPPLPEFDENVAVARFAAALYYATGRQEYREMTSVALRWLLAPGMTDGHGFYVAGLLLAEEEARSDPLHIAVIGGKDDPVAAAMYAIALRAPTEHKLIEWWDRRDGPPPRGEDIYPHFARAAAFVCSNGACSSPIFEPGALARRLKLPPPGRR